MIKNYYYLVVGILSMLFAFTHAWNGQTSFLPVINESDIGLSSKMTIFYVWHIITVENLIFGMSFIVMSVYKDLSKVKITAWIIAIIMVARWVVIFGSVLLKNKDGIAETLIDSIAIFVMVGLIILGTRKI